ncbi:hypothetical protein Sjap_006787 [Stephania japonica]|uniref:Uncharacterized protein n=1 Tax=Stephania japonica TaxID=461633 RepID=A0AAP0K8B9_9MAGN
MSRHVPVNMIPGYDKHVWVRRSLCQSHSGSRVTHWSADTGISGENDKFEDYL